jgi:hypothetical protein
MKKNILEFILTLVIGITLVACNGNAPKESIPSTIDVYRLFADAELSVGNYIDYTEATDPNGLMNKNGQYIAKLNFAIDGVFQIDEENNPKGGSIEIFKNSKDAKARKEAIDKIGAASPMLTESSEIINDVILIRLDRTVTATDARLYFDAVKNAE